MVISGYPIALGSLRNSHNKLEKFDIKNNQWIYMEGADYPYSNA